jgi:hypothetical protein
MKWINKNKSIVVDMDRVSYITSNINDDKEKDKYIKINFDNGICLNLTNDDAISFYNHYSNNGKNILWG